MFNNEWLEISSGSQIYYKKIGNIVILHSSRAFKDVLHTGYNHFFTMPQGYITTHGFYQVVPLDYLTVQGILRFDPDGKVLVAASQEGYHLAPFTIMYSL